MANARKSLRKAIWPSGTVPDPRDIAEALRDIDTAFRSLSQYSIAQVTNTPGGTAFVVRAPEQPMAVVVGRVVFAGSPNVAPWGSAVDWTWNGSQITVKSIAGLVAGSGYDITLLIFG